MVVVELVCFDGWLLGMFDDVCCEVADVVRWAVEKLVYVFIVWVKELAFMLGGD